MRIDVTSRKRKMSASFYSKDIIQARKSGKELIDVLNLTFGNSDQVDQNQPASPIGAVINEVNLLSCMKLDNPVQDIYLFKDSKDKSVKEHLQLIKHELVDISRFPDYKHTAPTGRKREGWIWKYGWDFKHLTQKRRNRKALQKWVYKIYK